MTARLRRLAHRVGGGDGGFSIVLVALLLVVFMIVTAIVVDLGNARQQKREAQAAADAGALAGATDLYASPHVPSGCTDANCSAAYYTFNSVQIVPGSAASLLAGRGSCTQETVFSGETCFQYTLNGTTVDVKSPYVFAGAPHSDMLHVKVCWNAPTTFARVIGTNNVSVCGFATAQNTGSGGGSGGTPPPLPDCSVEDNLDPGTAPNAGVYVFATGDYPDENKPLNLAKGNAVPKAHTDLVALFDGHGTDIDLNSIVFKAPTTANGQSGQNDTLSRIVPNSIHGPESSNAIGQKYVVQSLDANGKVQPYAPGGTFKILVSYELPDSTHLKVGGKNFVYTATVHVTDSDNAGASPPTHCANASWTFTQDGNNLPTGGTTCGENSFFAFSPIVVAPGPNGSVKAGQSTVVAFYNDESHLQDKDIDDPFWVTNPPDLGIDFSYTDIGTGITTHIPKAPALVAGLNAPGYTVVNSAYDSAHSGHESFNAYLSWPVPATMPNGGYSITAKAYDTDNNKPGNDCGVFTWTVTVTGGSAGHVNLIE